MKYSIKYLITQVSKFLGVWLVLFIALWLVCIFFGAPLNYQTWSPLSLVFSAMTTLIGAVAFANID